MTLFKGSILVLGCGSVSQCTLPILFKEIEVDPKRVTIIDMVDTRNRIKEVLEKGATFVQEKITPENYAKLFNKYLKRGDFLLDLSTNLETSDLIQWCHDNGVLYLNTSVEDWDPYQDSSKRDPRELTLYARQMKMRAIISRWKEKGATAVMDHGANPGLVSHFTKQALIDIARKIISEKPQDQRVPKLEQYINEKNFPQLAYLTGVKVIHISERDTQIINKPKEVNEFVNTWSIEGFIEEGSAPSELGWGTHEKTLPQGAMSHASGPKNQICLPSKGINTLVRSWVPLGPIVGMVVRHGEAFSISDYLTVREGDKAIYRPTVHYAYCPCDAAINSMHEYRMRDFVPQQKQRIVNNEIISGQDQLGCLLMGHDFTSWWIGSLLDIEEARKLAPGQNATTLQVAASVVAAMVYMIHNPNLGFCLPDQFEHEEILKIAKPYLGPFISQAVDWTPLYQAPNSLDFKRRKINPEDMWQFKTFLINAY